MSIEVKFRRVVTGYRCLESNCYNTAVWYIETEAEFFHWCPKHTVSHMRDAKFWRKRETEAYGKPRTTARNQARSEGRR